ncbi:MAG: MotA/TolQ/ExbB proton channel family protein [Zoogloeaceae bacterium]|nr:MotA/TolQ/ExbB proton channel family protein [Rhodocyclaceae bacterium]MCP5236453.1 MotA/TolQ/ExbB proton channel family protein [Zoogloeaceae bacterium]
MDNTSTPFARFDLAHLWHQGDAVSHAVALVLLAMSIVSWTLILSKLWRSLKQHREETAVVNFWRAPGIAEGIDTLARHAPGGAYHELACQAAAAHRHFLHHGRSSLGGDLGLDEFLVRAMRRQIARSTAQIESGLTVLASIGSTAPFVGLFGTVWGIYHALSGIAQSGMATLDKVAGPVGEALIMTAAGLFVAIPAVLAYNALTRNNRLRLAALDGFAHDLHAQLATGARIAPMPIEPAATARDGAIAEGAA